MVNEVNAVILEDDYFSRNWMSLILARDWRTRVVADVATDAELISLLRDKYTRIDMIILDAEIYRDLKWVEGLLDLIAEHPNRPKILFTSVWELPEITYFVGHPLVRGYLIKGDIRFSLNWAVDVAADGDWILTPKAEDFLGDSHIPLPRPRVIIEGQDTIPGLSADLANTARLAFIFSMERTEMSDELVLSQGWVYGKISELYEKIGVNGLLAGEMKLEHYLGEDPIILKHFRKIMSSFNGEKQSKAKQKETLAFHLLTQPLIRKIP